MFEAKPGLVIEAMAASAYSLIIYLLHTSIFICIHSQPSSPFIQTQLPSPSTLNLHHFTALI